VRKDSHVTDLQNRSAAVAAALKSGQVEVAVVPDFLDQEAIYTALQGVTVIIYIASPLAVQVRRVLYISWTKKDCELTMGG
jgi:uncharacterized protein YbjT (DUF2867 family)